MLTDNEVKNHKEDSLQYKTLCDTLVGIIMTSQTPITIGVFGEWGSGKTSLMRLTENDLNTADTKTVWFNAWKFDKAQDLRVALIHMILKQIEKDKSIPETVKDKAVSLLKRVNWLGLGRTAVTVGASLATPYLAILPLLSQVFSDSKKGTESLSKILPDELLKDTEGKSLELIGEFEEEFKKLALDYAGKEGRLVVFIDDLDRCLPEKALDILEAIKLFLNVPQTVFVIGTDVKVIENGLLQKYGDKSETFAKNYLDKIIQVPFRIPPLSKEDITEHFIPMLQISDELKEYGFIIADAGNNPRTIKRLLNNIELQKILSKSRDIIVEEIILVKLNVLEFRWKEFHSDLVELYAKKNENLLKIMDQYENSDEAGKEKLLKDFPLLSKYILNFELMDFLNKEPSLDDIEVGPYIHLQKTTSSAVISGEYGGDIDKYFQLGYTNYNEKNYIKAVDYFTRTISLSPKYKQAYYNRGLACYYLGYYKRAISDFNKTAEIDPAYKSAFYWLGASHGNLNETEQSLKNYSKAIELDPYYIEAYYDRGLVNSGIPDPEKAVLDFSKTIELSPDKPEYYFRRALAYFSLEKYEESADDNTRAIELKTDFTDAYINRGLTYNRLKRNDKALSDYSAALEISPESELAYNNLAVLLNDLLKIKETEPMKTDVDPVLNKIKKINLSGDKKEILIKLIEQVKS